MKRILFVLALLGLVASLPVAADVAPAGECGGIKFFDDPELPTRLRVFVGESDLSIMSFIVEAVTLGAGEKVISLDWHITGEKSTYDCAVMVSQVDPAFPTPSSADALIAQLRANPPAPASK